MNARDRKFWIKRLPALYEEAKKRHGGASLSIYSEVTDLLDYLEEVEPLPPNFDLAQACDNLAGRLHTA